MACDTLFIYETLNQRVNIPCVKNINLQNRVIDGLHCKKKEVKPTPQKKSNQIPQKKSNRQKKKRQNQKDILHLVIRQLSTGIEDILKKCNRFQLG
jgi:hypothetical protein